MFPTDSSLKKLVHNWSSCTLPAQEFTHAAHVAVCSYLIGNNTLAQSYFHMKAGLFRFNEAVGTPNTDERGYHETLTRFWCTLLFYKIHRGHFNSCLEAANAMIAAFQNHSRADRCYYSFDVLKSKEARLRWIAPSVTPPDLAWSISLESFHW